MVLSVLAAPKEEEVGRSFDGRDWIIRSFAIVTLLYMTYYIVWRWTSTVNWHAAWFGVPLVLAETYIAVRAYFTAFECWKLTNRAAPPAPPNLGVDVFITTYNEPVE